MRSITVVKSKITMPQLSGSIIVSDRIKKLANAVYQKNAVMISSPSGYGKTTFMTYTLASNKAIKDRICWYRLEQEDMDLAVFYACFIKTLFPDEEKQWEEIRGTLKGFADQQSQYRYINAMICQELWAFYDRNRNFKTFIVFDDFQYVMCSHEIVESIAYFVNSLPETFTILVSSRQQIDILTEKQKMEKSIMEISQNELRFEEKEIAQLLMHTYQIKAHKKLMQKIQNSTEGWIAGIIMACQIISESGAAEADHLLEKPWQKTRLFNYMASEVLKNLDADLMEFLVKASVLQDFTIESAEEILDIKNASPLVTACEKKGLFIQKTFKENVIYHFHNVFRDALLQLQKEYLSDEEVNNLHLKAAAFYVKHMVFKRAIEHFIVCGDINSAVELVTRESVAFLTFEAVEQLRVWFSLLPEEVVEQNPNLLFIKSYTYHQGKSRQPLILMEKAATIFREKNNTFMQVTSLMALTNYAMITNKTDEVFGYVSQALEVLKYYKNKAEYKYLSRSFSLLRAIFGERFSRAVAFSSYLRNYDSPDEWKWGALVFSSVIGSLVGDLDYAEKAIKETFEVNIVKRTELFRGYSLAYYGNILYLKNDIAALEAIEDELMAIGQKYDFNFILGLGRKASAYGKYIMHDLESATDLLESSTYNFEMLGNTSMMSVNKLCSLLWLSRKKNPKELLSEAKAAFRPFSSLKPGLCLKEISSSIFGAIARECGEYKLAEQSLLTSIQGSEAKGAKQILCGSCLHLAKLYFDTGETVKAENYLEKAFSLASENRYSMFWDIHLPTVAEMSAYCIKNGIYTEYAEELIKKHFKQEAVVYIKRSLSMDAELSLKDLSGRILSKFGIIDNTVFSYTIDIHLFGKFSIAVNGITIPDDEWKTKKIKGILEYLLLHKGKLVARDQLMEAFWPDSDKKYAAMSLSAALYALKKVLLKYGVKNEGNARFIHERAGGLEIKPNRMLFTDVDEFRQLYNDYKNKNNMDKKRKMEMLGQMTAIYKGNMLEEEIYSDWSYIDREELKTIFLEVSTALALLYIKEKEFNTAEKLMLKILLQDPYNEEICFYLINLYISLNQRSRAIKLYTDFEKRLKKDMDINPDDKLLSAIRSCNP